MNTRRSKLQVTQRGRFAGLFLLVVSIAACGAPDSTGDSDTPAASAAETANDARLSVFVVNYPLQYFAERIGGDLVDVSFPAPADVDPAYWRPDVEVMADYQAADLIVRNGAGYAKWIDMASLPDSKVVYTSAAFFDQVIVEDSGVTHSHGPEGEHSHGETASTTWLDPMQAIQQAEAIAEAFGEALPDDADAIVANFEALRAELEELDARLAAATTAMGQGPMIASHPVYQYLARRYGLDLRALLWESDEAPSTDAWTDLGQLLTEHPATVMLWDAQPSAATRQRLQELGIAVAVFDPAGNRPAAGDYMDVMRTNAANLEGLAR